MAISYHRGQHQADGSPRNLYDKELLWSIPEGGRYEKNPFKGNMDIEKLEQLIEGVGAGECAADLLSLTNNPVCGQAVSMHNIKEINRVAHSYNIPVVFDVARWGGKLLLYQDERGGLRR